MGEGAGARGGREGGGEVAEEEGSAAMVGMGWVGHVKGPGIKLKLNDLIL